ncbi:fumarylacetoacetate hydrolase family protein [Lysinibacter sp. HNR]|uniref:fumarylacetoacetate hydrolase family protein n=1 Tax=Lysinibacter sp. HNR TaxID=3031408 RepID=UPI002434937C|nr:fumarylacetoacetate hydrolase family protein [Lysinibacter sp. HNR]WGD37448.1 fumarylacetoacetate hydrolase family protein [Lysinibacter sp. HNR]
MIEGFASPGKIIAVHLNYPSRMTQRGRTPSQPSYFFKPSSSLAATGSSIELPADTELLAFEGEIALIVGTPARRVSPEDGWSHVTQVTAANDFGLYDLRAVDKGSNVRSKGGDGFTPIGPRLIPTAGIAEDAWRVRTWVNGTLVQQDTSDTLAFTFGRLIADLSQLMTLETGDVILTGTPAGSSVVLPGDTVEVEVDAPKAPGNPTTGKLITTITQGNIPFGEYGATPRVDDLQRIEAWGSEQEHAAAVNAGRATPLATATTPVTTPTPAAATATAQAQALGPGSGSGSRSSQAPATAPVLTDTIRAQLSGVAVATVSAALRKRGYINIFIDGVHPNHEHAKILGTAKTLRFIPFRPDLFAQHGGGFNAQKRAFDTVAEGEVLVIEARGIPETGTVGDVLALRAQVRGAAGIVTDGGVRDFAAVREFDIPVFSQGPHPSVLGRKHVPWETDVTIACGGAAVQPGDIIMGDRDGVIVIPPPLLAEVAADAVRQEHEDAWIAEQVAAGASVDGLFPMNSAWRAQYEADQA